MEMRHLRLVRTLATEGTLTAAGKKLYLSQSALSHQLREIEDEFGVTLFRRIKKRMVLTTAGERLLNSADIVLGEIDSARNDITHMNSGDHGTLRISACRHASLHWLPTVLKSLKEDYPGVDVCIDRSVERDPTENLLAGTIDLAIVNVKTDHSRIVHLKLFDDQMVAVVCSDHPWASRRKVTARHFADQHLINYDLPFEEVEFNKTMLVPSKVVPKSLTKVPTTDAIIELVKAGMGVAVLNLWSVKPYLESQEVCCVSLSKHGFSRTWYAAVTDDRRKPPYISHFIGYLAKSQA